MKIAVLHTRIASALKAQSEFIFDQIGLSSSDAILNKTTSETLQKSDRNIGIKTFDAPEAAFAEWDNL